MRTLYFCPVVSFYRLLSSFFFYSSPNLSGCRLDVCHTSTHGVALVRIQNAGLKYAARGSLEIQDAEMMQKNRHLSTIAQLCRAISSQLRHISTIKKNLLSSNISPTCPYNMVNFGLLPAEIVSLVWGTLQISTGFASWQHYCTAKLRRWTEGATCIRQGGNHVGHWPTFLVFI